MIATIAEASAFKVRGIVSIKTDNANLLESTSFADKKIDSRGDKRPIYFSDLDLVITDDEATTSIPIKQEDFTLTNDGEMYIKNLKIGTLDVREAKAKLKASYEAYLKADPRAIPDLIPTTKMDVELDPAVDLNFQFKISKSNCIWKGGLETTGNQSVIVEALINNSQGEMFTDSTISNKSVTCKNASTLAAGSNFTLMAIFYVVPAGAIVDTASGGKYSLKDVESYVEYAANNPKGFARDIKRAINENATPQGYVDSHSPNYKE